MAILILSDNAGIGCAKWVLRSLTEDICAVLRVGEHAELADWLSSDDSPVHMYSELDIRDLTPDNQKAFLSSIEPAFLQSKSKGPEDWNDPSAWDSYLALFEQVVNQAKLLASGKSPVNLPNLKSIPPHKGDKDGPGWS